MAETLITKFGFIGYFQSGGYFPPFLFIPLIYEAIVPLKTVCEVISVLCESGTPNVVEKSVT